MKTFSKQFTHMISLNTFKLRGKYLFNQICKRFSVVGIDLGGTNAYVAIMEPSGPRIIENAEGLRSSPSVVSYDEEGKEYVATAAKRQAITNLYSSFYGASLFFGKKFDDKITQDLIKRYPFKIERGPDNEIYFLADMSKINQAMISTTPVKVSSSVLKYVKDQTEAFMGKPMKKVVMSVPLYYNENGRKDAEEAAKQSGMQVLRFVDESVASAYAYNLDKNEKVKNVLVFNFGGSVFSLTYLTKNNKETKEEPKEEPKEETGEKQLINPNVEFVVKSYNCDYFLGGEDIDKILEKFLLDEFKKLNKMELTELFAIQRIREAVEKAKIELTLSTHAEISLPFLAADASGPKHLNMRLSRPKFEMLTDNLFTKMRDNCRQFLSENKIDKDKDIDDIILVGGISRIPRVQELIKNVFGKEPNKTLNPEEAPVLGASMIASLVKTETEEISSFDKLPLSVGIETLGGQFLRIFERGTVVPCRVTKSFQTASDFQPNIEMKFYMGEREIASENRLVGSTKLKLVLTEKKEQKINITFSVAENGDLNLSVVDTLSRKASSKINMKLDYSCKLNAGLTKEGVEDIIQMADKFKEADRLFKDLIEVKLEADNFITSLQKKIKNNEEIFSENQENLSLKENMINLINELNELLKGDKYTDLVNKYDELQKVYQNIEKILNPPAKERLKENNNL